MSGSFLSQVAPAAFAGFEASCVAHWIGGEFTSPCAELHAVQLAELSPAAVAAFQPTCFEALPATSLVRMTPTQVKSFSNSSCRAMTSFQLGYLPTPDAFVAMTPACAAQLSTSCANLTSARLSPLAAEAVGELGPGCVTSLPHGALSAVSLDQAVHLQPGFVALMSVTLLGDLIVSVGTDAIKEMSYRQFSLAIDHRDAVQSWYGIFKRHGVPQPFEMAVTDPSVVTVLQALFMATSQVASYSADDFVKAASHQALTGFRPAALSAAPSSVWSKMSEATLPALTDPQWAALPGASLAAIPGAALTSYLNEASYDVVRAISPTAYDSLPPTELQQLNALTINEMCPATLSKVSDKLSALQQTEAASVMAGPFPLCDGDCTLTAWSVWEGDCIATNCAVMLRRTRSQTKPATAGGGCGVLEQTETCSDAGYTCTQTDDHTVQHDDTSTDDHAVSTDDDSPSHHNNHQSGGLGGGVVAVIVIAVVAAVGAGGYFVYKKRATDEDSSYARL